MNTKQFERQLRKEKAKLETQLHRIGLTLDALAHLTGKRIVTVAAPRAFRQSAKARKAISAAKKAWWIARRKKLAKTA